ncbi:MAG: PIG-L family deacetylase [bacterium]|nr:PIG-L family deacetylase [Candidatus Kapabacteria bacterium]
MHAQRTMLSIIRHVLLFAIGVGLFASAKAVAQTDSTLRVLIVTAHPDDDAAFAATVYKITHDLRGHVDLALITNGEGGYRYSTLAESLYGLELTDEKVGREHLPTIRKRELMNGGAIIGIRNYYFLEQVDNQYTLDVDSVFKHVWDVDATRARLKEIIERGGYHYIFGLMPTPETHGHHKGATILALQASQQIPMGRRPVVLACTLVDKPDTAAMTFRGLPNHPLTKISTDAPVFTFDRTQKFGFRDRLDYKIIVNWLIAEHKSQGTMQLGMNSGDIESFWYFDANDRSTVARTRALFDRLAQPMFKARTY